MNQKNNYYIFQLALFVLSLSFWKKYRTPLENACCEGQFTQHNYLVRDYPLSSLLKVSPWKYITPQYSNWYDVLILRKQVCFHSVFVLSAHSYQTHGKLRDKSHNKFFHTYCVIELNSFITNISTLSCDSKSFNRLALIMTRIASIRQSSGNHFNHQFWSLHELVFNVFHSWINSKGIQLFLLS